MKKLPDKADIVDQIVTALGRPLRQHRSEAKAYAAVERAIETLREGPFRQKPKLGEELGEDRDWYFRCGPHAASVRKAAKKLLKTLKPYSGWLPVNLKDPLPFRKVDEFTMQLQVWSSGLDWLAGHTDADVPPPSTKYLAAEFAYGLVNEFSQKPPTGTAPPTGKVREIAGHLYRAVAGGKWCDLHRETYAVIRNRKRVITVCHNSWNEPTFATIGDHKIFREPGEDEEIFRQRALAAARDARAGPAVLWDIEA